MKPQRVAIVTCKKHPSLVDDDRLLLKPLEELGWKAVPAVWNNSAVKWDEFDGVIVRSPWDYFLKYKAFLKWLDDLEQIGARVHNPAGLMRWNSDKRYLNDLEALGIKIIPTIWIENKFDLAEFEKNL